MAKVYTDSSVLSFEAATNISTKQYYLVKQVIGGKIDIPNVDEDICIGVLLNKPLAGETASVRMLNSAGSCWMVASAAITEGSFVVMAIGTERGKIRALPAVAGNYYIVGKAIESATANGDIIEIMLISPTLRVVT